MKPEQADQETGVGVRVHFTGETNKWVTYFWGYRNHTVFDAESELTLWEETHPANVSEVKRAIPMLQAVKQSDIPIDYVAADSEYDVGAMSIVLLICPWLTEGPANRVGVPIGNTDVPSTG